MCLRGWHRRLIVCSLLVCLSLLWTARHVFEQRLDVAPEGAEVDVTRALLRHAGFQGTNARPELKSMTLISELPAKHRLEAGRHDRSNRLVIVGDVHGQKQHLEALLRKVEFAESKDHLVLVGDMIAKGPDSAGVVDLAMQLGASAVRGNHEDRVITAYDEMELVYGDAESPAMVEIEESERQGVRNKELNRGDSKERRLARELGPARMKWLAGLPVILKLGTMGSMQEVVVVHAGLAPGVELTRQDPSMVMNMRTIDTFGIPSSKKVGLQWTKVWNEFQHSVPDQERMTVIYGHNQKLDLQLHDYSFGLDTGCINQKTLTALVLEERGRAIERRLVQIGC